MTAPRAELFAPEEVGIYHCYSRCVRRAYLCGIDPITGSDCNYRRAWIWQKSAELLKIFAIDAFALAVLETHFHNLLRNRPDISLEWSPEEVARRWLILFPANRRRKSGTSDSAEINSYASNPQLISEARKRLSSISWFHRCLKEAVAVRANKEEKITGHFWEGRFRCKRIIGDQGLISCAAYIDLNAIRARAAQTPENSDFISIQARIDAILGRPPRSGVHMPLASFEIETNGALTETDYVSLVDLTGRCVVEGKASIPPALLPILERLGLNPAGWMNTATSFEKQFKRIVGTPESIRASAEKMGRPWCQGVGAAKAIFKSR